MVLSFLLFLWTLKKAMISLISLCYQVYVIDLGLAKRYRDANTNCHIPCKYLLLPCDPFVVAKLSISFSVKVILYTLLHLLYTEITKTLQAWYTSCNTHIGYGKIFSPYRNSILDHLRIYPHVLFVSIWQDKAFRWFWPINVQ